MCDGLCRPDVVKRKIEQPMEVWYKLVNAHHTRRSFNRANAAFLSNLA